MVEMEYYRKETMEAIEEFLAEHPEMRSVYEKNYE